MKRFIPRRILGGLAVAVLAGTGAAAVSAVPAAAAASACSSFGITPAAGSGQTAKVNTAFATALQALVCSPGTSSQPVPNVQVTFSAPASGPGGVFQNSGTSSITVTTDQNGLATAGTFVANSTPGSYNVTATSPYTSSGQAMFALTNTTSGVATTITPTAGNNQSATVGQPYAAPLSVSLVDANGNPIPAASVTFTIVPGAAASGGPGAPSATWSTGGAAATVTSNSSGVATSPNLTAGAFAGGFTVVASNQGVNATFNETNLAAAPNAVAISAGGSQATPIGTAFPVAFTVTVTDANKNPVPSAPVTFGAPASGATGTFSGGASSAVVNTDANGVAAAPTFTANGTTGGYIVTASTPGVSSVAFSLVNQAPGASSTGYWLAAADGGIFSYGSAQFYGSAGNLRLAAPIVGMAATPDGRGYWLVASDGGIFTFGDAHFFGSAGAMRLNQPVTGMAATPDGAGYWLVASDGGIFSFGSAAFSGSAGALPLTQSIIGMSATPDGRGYWLVAADGGLFNYGDAGFFGAAAQLGDHSIRAMAPSPGGNGYWMSNASGVVYGFGSAPISGSPAASGVLVASPIVAMATP